MKPKHRPPKTALFSYDPVLKLLALNVLIEAHNNEEIPKKVIVWAVTYLAQSKEFESYQSGRKQAA